MQKALWETFVISSVKSQLISPAHHYVRNHPANEIMRIYHRRKAKGGPATVPSILGLTASPIQKSRPTDLRSVLSSTALTCIDRVKREIESNLDAVTVTPRLHRQELMRHVHHPTFIRLSYVPWSQEEDPNVGEALRLLTEVHQQFCAGGEEFPLGTSRQHRRLGWKDHVSALYQKARYIHEELGQWAAECFIRRTICELRVTANTLTRFSFDQDGDLKLSLLRVFDREEFLRPMEPLSEQSHLSRKVQCLIDFLEDQRAEECSGLIFVRQRATVSMLYTLLSSCPRTATRFRCGTFVGVSACSRRKYNVSELLDLKTQQSTINDFRSGVKNLLIATSVLEEGIDVTACNLVICFDAPSNLKSFIQRRGRARMERSNFAIMMSRDIDGSKVDLWRGLEAELIKTYQDQERQRAFVASKELEEEQVEHRIFIEATE